MPTGLLVHVFVPQLHAAEHLDVFVHASLQSGRGSLVCSSSLAPACLIISLKMFAVYNMVPVEIQFTLVLK